MPEVFSEYSLALSLQEKADRYLQRYPVSAEPLEESKQIGIDFPYSSVGRAPWDAQFDQTVLDSFEALSGLFKPENVSPEWIAFAKEVNLERGTKGSRGLVNLVDGLLHLGLESEYAKANGYSFTFPMGQDGWMDYTDTERIRGMINTILANPQLRSDYKKILVDLIPDVAGDELDKEKATKLLKFLGLGSGTVLDVGCGIGRNTVEWARRLGTFTIGLDRQYHFTWYDPYWQKDQHKQPNLEFVRADFNEGLPFADSSIDVVLMQFVAQYVTEESLAMGLGDLKRVIKEGGLLAVGPQETGELTAWRFFKKEKDPEGQVCFVEYSYYDFFPAEKPKWLKKLVLY